MTQPSDKWDEIAKQMKESWRWPLREPGKYWPKESDIANALRNAYAEGERTGMERAAQICDAYKWECVKNAEHDPEPMYDRARSYGCQELIERIRAAMKETE